MPPNEYDLLGWMLEAAEMASAFSRGRVRSDLDNDLLFFYAVTKAVELIGEAASGFSRISRAEYRAIAWEEIIGMRQVLVHDFHNIDKNELWDTVQKDVPALIPQLQAALAQHDR